MEAIAIIGVLTILDALIARWVNLYRQGRKEPKNNPVHIKKLELVTYNHKEYMVLNRVKNNYDLLSTDGLNIQVSRVNRSQLKLVR